MEAVHPFCYWGRPNGLFGGGVFILLLGLTEYSIIQMVRPFCYWGRPNGASFERFVHFATNGASLGCFVNFATGSDQMGHR